MLSRLIGQRLARAIWPEQLAKYAREVSPWVPQLSKGIGHPVLL